MRREKLIIFTGAGMSAESGLKTFRGSGGLWEGHDVQEVATPRAWDQNPQLVLNFYNERRRQTLAAKPNEAHITIAQLESQMQVQVITQNVDNLHERAGSTNVLHLHGQLTQARSCKSGKVYDIHKDINIGDYCPEGGQLRPNIVWFGEAVPAMDKAAELCAKADYFAVIGTSLQVYPAAYLIDYVKPECRKWIIDPDPKILSGFEAITNNASEGVKILLEQINLKQKKRE